MNYNDALDRGRNRYGDKFNASELSSKFIQAFDNGGRIAVRFGIDGEVRRGRVGITTGCLPRFLLILRRSDRGSSWTLGDNDNIVGIVKRDSSVVKVG